MPSEQSQHAPRSRRATRSLRAGWRESRERLLSLPAWLISLVLHIALMFALLAAWRSTPGGAAAESTRDVGIVIAHRSEEGDYYEGESDAGEADTSESPATEMLDEPPPFDPSDSLPEAADILGPGSEAARARLSASGMQEGSRASRSLAGGAARTEVFGLEGEGTKFLYVFDRSASMGGSGRSALATAKAELLASLDSLGSQHQFQIIFYNDRATLMQLARQPGGLVFGTDQNKVLARKFVGGITADGGTRHLGPLEMALRLGPDVVFFLTDADQPELSAAELARIRRLNGGRASINAIEFGLGPSISEGNFIVKLAQQNGGRYQYIDISKFAAGR